MTAAAQSLPELLDEQVGGKVKDIRLLSSGVNAELFLLDIRDGRRLIAKIARGQGGNLALEGWMLTYLSEHTQLLVPHIYQATDEFILMDYVESGGPFTEDVQINVANHLAALHNHTAEFFGFERDTLIGPLPQPNPQTASWTVFFREQRLLPMADKALAAGAIDSGMRADIDKLAGKLETLIDAPAQASLIHGDMWGGNVLAARGKVAAFIDPAIYHADSEMELAFITLFNTFGDAFFDAYNERRKIRPGFWEVRRPLYNLYPLLIHALLFGGGYVTNIQSVLKRFA